MGTFLQKSHLVGAFIEWDKMAHGRALHQKSRPLHHLHHVHGLCPYGTYSAPVAGTWPPIGGAIPLDAVCDVIQLDTCNGHGLDKSLCKPNKIVWRPCEGGAAALIGGAGPSGSRCMGRRPPPRVGRQIAGPRFGRESAALAEINVAGA